MKAIVINIFIILNDEVLYYKFLTHILFDKVNFNYLRCLVLSVGIFNPKCL